MQRPEHSQSEQMNVETVMSVTFIYSLMAETI